MIERSTKLASQSSLDSKKQRFNRLNLITLFIDHKKNFFYHKKNLVDYNKNNNIIFKKYKVENLNF